jgi:hypothetical protein
MGSVVDGVTPGVGGAVAPGAAAGNADGAVGSFADNVAPCAADAVAGCAPATSTKAQQTQECRNLENGKLFYELTSLRCEYNAMRIPKPASSVTTELPP